MGVEFLRLALWVTCKVVTGEKTDWNDGIVKNVVDLRIGILPSWYAVSSVVKNEPKMVARGVPVRLRTNILFAKGYPVLKRFGN